MIIGICGGTGSGKTTIARKIVEEVGVENVILLEQDSYYRNLIDMPLDERHLANFDHPDSIDTDMLIGHLKRLREGLDVERPIYDFKTHTRSSEIAVLHPRPVMMVEGILIFAEPRIRELLDIRVFVDTPDDIRFIRRLQRDIRERGRTTESVIEQYFATVRPDAYGICRAVEKIRRCDCSRGSKCRYEHRSAVRAGPGKIEKRNKSKGWNK